MTILLSKYLGKSIIYNQQGVKIGKLDDLVVSKETGKIISYIVKLTDTKNIISKLPKLEKGLIMVPFPFISFTNEKFYIYENEIAKFLEKSKKEQISYKDRI